MSVERVAKKFYPEMTLDFCTEVDCLARPFCPGLKKNNRLYEYEETGLTPEQVRGMMWIPAKEQLPGREEVERYYRQNGDHPQYLVMIANAVLATVLSFDGEGWYDSYTDETYHVTHWMPLPAAPQREIATSAAPPGNDGGG